MKKSLLTILCVLLSTISWAQGTTAGDSTAVAEPYAVLSADSLTVTFYYDNQKSARGGMDINNSYIDDGNSSPYGTATMAVFDASFANYLPTSTAYWFQRCNLLTEIRGLSNLNSANVTNMRFMFDNCSSLTNLDMSGFNTTNVTDMVLLFAGCSALTSLDLSGLNTTNVTEMNWMFDGCSSLTSLDVSGFNTANVTNMSGMFHECSSLTSLDLSGFNTANVTNMSWMFERCSALTNIYVSSTWTTSQVTANNGSNMFNECVNLVGGAGTTFSADHTDYTYARIDAEGTPGYLTDSKNASMTHFVMITVEGNGEVSAGQTTVMGGNEQEVTVLAGDSIQMYFFPAHDWTLGSLKVDDADVTSEVTRNSETGTLQYLLTVSGSHSVNVTFTEVTPEAYAVLTDNQDVISQGATGITYGKTLTFYYDTNKSSHSGAMSVGPFVEHSDREWNNVVNYITSVVFDESFANYTALTSTAQWFSGCSYLSSISGINNLKTDNVTDMHDMFVGCNFTTLDLSSFNTSNVTNMGYMFSGCSNMTSIDLSSFNTVKVASMNSMFHGCYALKTIYVGSEWTTSNVTESSEMFYGCSNLVGGAGTTYNANKIDYTYAHIDGGENNPGYFTDKNAPASYVITVTSYGNGQVSVEGVPEVVEDGKKAEVAVTAGSSLEMFFFPGEGYQLDSLMVDGINVTADVVPATEQSAASYTLNNINAVHNVITYFGEKASYNEAYAVLVSENNKVSLTLYYDGNKSRHSEGLAIGLDEMMTSQQFLGNREYIQEVTIDSSFVHCELTAAISMFAEFSALTTINDLKYLKTDKVTNMWRMFYACPKLTSLDVSGFNTANVTNMEAMFEGCSSLASLDVSGFNTANVTTMQRMFMGCRALETIDVSHFNTEKVTDMGSMFESCGALRSIDVSHFNTANVTNMGNMFVNCAGLTSLDVTNFNTSNVTNLFSTFSGCTGLTTLDLSSFNTAKVTDMGKTFLNCSALTTIYAGSEWTTASVTDGSDPFAYCTRLVGGKGTTYSADHWDYTYARIDGGPNSTTPGYFTDKNAPITVAAPEFRFEGDNLTMTTETQNAGIFYKVADLPSMDDAVVASVVNSLIVTADGQSTYYNQPFELKKAAVVKAIAIIRNETATFVSDTTTMVYDYEAWVNLKAAVESGVDLYSRAQGNPNVDTQLLEQLQWALNEGDMIYNNRAQMDSFEAAHFTQRINELCAQIEAQMAEDEPYAVLSDNDTKLTFYYDKKKATNNGMSVGPFRDRTESSWYSARKTITNVVFDDSFANCTSLTSTANWFAELAYLTTITGIGNLKTDNVTDMSNMFLFCRSLTSLDVTGFNTSNVTSMENMFYECSSLTSLDVSKFNTSKVTNMMAMFQLCSGLTALDVSNFDMSNVTYLMQMFCECSGLTSLKLGAFNIEKVTDIQGLFYGLSSMLELDLSSINTSNITGMSMLFQYCTSLTTLNLSNFNTANVANMMQMFFECTKLKTIYVGEGWTTSQVTNSERMFEGCTALIGGAGTHYDATHVDVAYAHIDGGTENPGYFTESGKEPWVEPTEHHDGDVLVATVDGIAWTYKIISEVNKTCQIGEGERDKPAIADSISGIVSVPAELDGYTVTTIGAWALYDRKNLTGVNLPATVTNIGRYGMDRSISLLTISKNNPVLSDRNANIVVIDSTNTVIFGCNGSTIPEGIVAIGEDAFRECSFPSVPQLPTSLRSVGTRAFFNCSGMMGLILPEGLENIDTQGFGSCGLQSISFPSTLTSLGSAAFDDNNFTSVYIPATLTWISSSPFEHNSNLTEIIVDAANPNYDSRDNCNAIIRGTTLLQGCNTTIIPNGITRLGWSAFQGMKHGLKTLVIPEGVTDLGDYTFYSCEAMEEVTIPSTVVTIGAVTFEDCISLRDIYCYIQNPFDLDMTWSGPFGTNEYGDRIYENANLHVPYGTKALYEAREGWKKFQHIVEMDIATSFVDGVLTVGGSNTLAEALDQFASSNVTERAAAIIWQSSANLTNSELQRMVNPNLLIYVTDETKAPADRNNIIVDGFAKNIVLTDVAQGNNDFYCPQSFTAEAISYTREFKQKTQIGVSRGWETIALPFNVQTIMHETRGLITPFGNNRSNTHFWLRRLTHDGLQSDSIIEANTAYLISMPNSEEYIAEYNLAGRVTFSAANVTVPVTEIIMDESANYMMAPVFQRLAAQNNLYVLNVGEQRNGYPEGSIFESNYRAVLPFQAYVEHKGSNPAPPFFVVGDLGGDTTGIMDNKRETITNNDWYTLDGRKLQGKPTQKGVYITNGKKVIIK